MATLLLALLPLGSCTEHVVGGPSPAPPAPTDAGTVRALAPIEAPTPAPAEAAPPALPAPPAPTCPDTLPAPWSEDARARQGTLIVVYKSSFLLGLYVDGRLVELPAEGAVAAAPACFPVAMGATPEGPKIRMDRASTPEGWYRVAQRRDVGQTAFHRGFLLDYPNAQDIDRALAAGVISASTARALRTARAEGRLPSQGTAMGGDILIHGSGSSPPNWTWGCVALDDADIDRIFARVRAGDDVLIVPWASVAAGPPG